jgi:hypothetical protein
MASGLENPQEEPPQSDHFIPSMVQGEPTSIDPGTTRSAHATLARAFQLLRSERQSPLFVDASLQGGTLLV